MSKSDLKAHARNCKAMEKASGILTREEFAECLKSNCWFCDYDNENSFSNNIINVYLHKNSFSLDRSLDIYYRYTESNLQELINASKVYERLEKIN